ncbi:MAG TPA: SMP-30/gluconolactonase/LRE family protein [Gemmataceae bacterium]
MRPPAPSSRRLLALAVLLSVSAPSFAADKEKLFVATPLTAENAFTAGIEGPACDAKGNIYAVNFAQAQTIGRVTPDGKGEIFVTLPGKSIGNGIVFDRKGMMYVADYAGHNVLRIDPATSKITVFAHNDGMNQPNDLAITADGTLYASDPNWGRGTGQIWRIDRDGKTSLAAEKMGTTNGIDVSPDGKTLYVNESVQRNVWAFDIGGDGSLSNKRLLKKFDDFGFDGMRCDVDGNLYISRYGKGTVAMLSPKGEVLREIDVLGDSPSNLCFGGPDGRTVYVTEVKKRRLVQFRVDRPGLAWQRLHEKEDGFTSLFNGKDFTGWRFSGGKDEDAREAANWKVKDGVVLVTGGGSPHLATAKEYADFELRLEWRALRDKYNSGLYVRSGRKVGANQINLAKGAEGGFIGGKATGAKTVPDLQKPAGEWNEWRVLAKGDKLTFWCNGKLAWEATGLKPAKGYIGLQAEGAPIEFRHLRIRELDH